MRILRPEYTHYSYSNTLDHWRVATVPSFQGTYASTSVLAKHVFKIDVETCSKYGGAVKVIACIQDPAVIEKILTHLQEKIAPKDLLPQSRAPPAGLFD